VAFSPDGKSFLTLSLERTARLWEVASDTSLGKPPQFQAFQLHATGDIVLDASAILDSAAARMAVPLSDEPERIELWFTVITGTELSSDGRGLTVLDAETWNKRRQQLKKLGGPPPGY
jgi:hypothetical protein